MTSERRKLQKEIYEWSDVEGDIQRTMQFAPVGGWWHRLFTWMANYARDEREFLREELRQLNEEERRAKRPVD